MRFLLLAFCVLVMMSCSKQTRQDVVGESTVAPLSENGQPQPSVENVAEESDTLDVRDSCIVAYEPTAAQQQRLLKANPNCEEALADFEFYSGQLADSLRGKLHVYYTSSRYWKVNSARGVQLQDTKSWISRNQAKDIGVSFLLGSKKPFVVTDVATNVDYYQVIQRLYGIRIDWNPSQDSTQ